MDHFSTNDLDINGAPAWSVRRNNQHYGPFWTEDEALKAAQELLIEDNAYLKDRNFSADVCKWWIKGGREFTVVMEQEPTFKQFLDPDDVIKCANNR